MIAVWYDDEATPFGLYVMDLPKDFDGQHHKFYELFKEEKYKDYPFPDNDVLFMENDEIVDQFHPTQGMQK